MNVNRIRKMGQSSKEKQKSEEQSLEHWLDEELLKMIDEEIQKLQTTENVQVVLDADALEGTKKNIADVIKGVFLLNPHAVLTAPPQMKLASLRRKQLFLDKH